MSERARLILRLLTAFVLGIVSLTLEIAYTRVISFKLFYYYTYFVIGLALLGLGAASAVVALSTKLRSLDTAQLLQRVAPAASFVGLLGYMVVARLPMTTDKIWSGTTSETIGQIIRLLVLSLSLTAVFFAIGLLLASIIVVEVEHVRRLYFWDLLGAALGCLVAVPLQLWIGPPAMIMTSLVLLGSLGLVAAVMSNQRVVLAGGLLLLIIAGSVFCLNLEVRTDNAKNAARRHAGRGRRVGARLPCGCLARSPTSSSCPMTACGVPRSGATTAPAPRRHASTATCARSRSARSAARMVPGY